MDKTFVPYTHYNKGHLNEAMQYKKVNFVSVREEDGKLIGIHPPVLCRDYLGDILYVTKMNKEQAYVYGLQYKKDRDGPLQLDRTKLVMIFNEKSKDKETLFRNINILWELEKQCGLKTTELTELDKNTLYVRGSKRWLDNNFTYSFYTFMLRALCYQQIKDQKEWYLAVQDMANKEYSATEGQYIKQISVEKFKTLLKNLKKFFIPLENPTGYSNTELSIMAVHSSSGFVAITQNGQYIVKDNKLIALSKKLFWNGKEDNSYDPMKEDEDWDEDDDEDHF